MKNKLLFISTGILIIGLVAQLLPMFVQSSQPEIVNIVTVFRKLSPDMKLSITSLEFYIFSLSSIGIYTPHQNVQSEFTIYFFDLIIYLLLLVGVLASRNNKMTSWRVIPFVYSVILIVKLFSLLGNLSSFFFSDIYVNYVLIISLLSDICWGGVSLFILLQYKKNITDTKELVQYGSTPIAYVDTPKSQRFFHLILDFLISLFVGSTLACHFIFWVNRQFSLDLSEGLMFTFVVFLAYIPYLVFFESLTARTPAKFLTGSVIISKSGKSPRFWNIVLRNVVRYIPYDVYTYMRDDGDGWHDEVAKTKVVKMQHT